MMWFKNLRTMPKLMLGFGTLALLMLFVGYQGITGMNTINDLLNTLYERDMLGIAAIKDFGNSVAKIGRETRQAVIDTDLASVQSQEQRVQTYFTAADDALARAEKTFTTEQGKAVVAKLKQDLPEFQTAVREVLRLTMANDKKGAADALAQARAVAERVAQAAQEGADLKEKFAKQSHE